MLEIRTRLHAFGVVEHHIVLKNVSALKWLTVDYRNKLLKQKGSYYMCPKPGHNAK